MQDDYLIRKRLESMESQLYVVKILLLFLILICMAALLYLLEVLGNKPEIIRISLMIGIIIASIYLLLYLIAYVMVKISTRQENREKLNEVLSRIKNKENS